jgi:ribosome-binding factor A
VSSRRIPRLNSLLKEVISEVVRDDVSNPHVAELITITKVEITADLHYAKVFFSVIGTDAQKKQTLDALQSAHGYIAVLASKKVVLRHFPELSFFLDTSVETQIRIDSILRDIDEEKKARSNNEPS